MQKFLLLRSLNKMTHEKETTKQQRWAIGLSIGLHGILLVIFYFLPIWKHPFSLSLEYGLEMHFEPSNLREVPAPVQAQEIAKQQNIALKAIEKAEKTQPSRELENKLMQDTPTATQEAPPPEESPLQSRSENEDIPLLEQGDEGRKVVRSTETTSLAERKNKATAQLDKQQKDNLAIDPNEKSVTKRKETPVENEEATSVDTVDERALYNANEKKPWNASLELADWRWDCAPQPKDTTDENGKIMFEIKIDDLGEIIAVKTLEKTVSSFVEKIYQEAVEKLTFSKTSRNASYAPTSIGKITFLIRSR